MILMKEHLKHFIPFLPLLLLAGSLYYFKNYMPDSLCLLQNQQTITITKDGFTPGEIVITQCTRVTFENKDNTEHWPASDLHPTHAIYPEFDPKQPVASGSSWSFTFTKAGSWKYHDDIDLKLKGVIQVK